MQKRQGHAMNESASPGHQRLGILAIAFIVAGLVIATLSVALVVALTSGRSGTPANAKPTAGTISANSPATVTMRGTVTMDRYEEPGSEFRSENWHRIGELNCEGIGGYDDMAEGVTVAVFDAASKVIEVGRLNQGLRVGGQCMWAFEVPGVPDLPFYQVEVSHRGRVPIQRTDIGTVSLRLG